MSDADAANSTVPAGHDTARILTPAARRALAEAESRRRDASAEPGLPPETNGRAGPEPTRFGDWEKNGILSDF